jgi:CBS domain-containing membrane protein
MTSTQFLYGEITEEDLYEALGELSGYVDITPGDLQKIYGLAWHHAAERLRRSARVGGVMSRDVATARRDTSALELAETMAGRRVSGLPVVEADGRVAGVVSERDLLPRISSYGAASAMALVAVALRNGGALRLEPEDQTAEDLMSTPAVTVGEGTPVGDALALLAAHSINRLPVVDADGRLVGIVSRGDLVAIP